MPGTDSATAIQHSLHFHVAARLNRGQSTESVKNILLAAGHDDQAASAIVDYRVAQRAPYDLARELLGSGLAPEEVHRKLTESGLDQQTSTAAVRHSVQYIAYVRRMRETAPTRLAIRILGMVVLVVGVALLVGNMTGKMRTVPFAGFVVMTAGSAIFWGRRAGWSGNVTGPDFRMSLHSLRWPQCERLSSDAQSSAGSI